MKPYSTHLFVISFLCMKAKKQSKVHLPVQKLAGKDAIVNSTDWVAISWNVDENCNVISPSIDV